MGKKNDERAERIGALATSWYDNNGAKNKAQNQEKKDRASLEVELANEGEMFVHKLPNGTFLEMGFADKETEEIDPKVFFEKYPDLFWEMVSIPKTGVIAKLGDKEAAMMTRVVHKNTFDIKKHKTHPGKVT